MLPFEITVFLIFYLQIDKWPPEVTSCHIMPLRMTDMTPAVSNQDLLASIFEFRPNSRLQRFINFRGKCNKTLFTFREVLVSLRDIILEEGLYDKRNPSVILCSEELEAALNMKALHITEIRNVVLKHLFLINPNLALADVSQISSQDHFKIVTSNPESVTLAAQKLAGISGKSTIRASEPSSTFTCKPEFLRVMQTLPNVNKDQRVFSYEEIVMNLSSYIMNKKHQFFDTRNVKLAMVKDDILGKAFGVDAFHRCQVHNLLRGQLTPINASSPNDPGNLVKPATEAFANIGGIPLGVDQATNKPTMIVGPDGSLMDCQEATCSAVYKSWASLTPSTPFVSISSKRTAQDVEPEGLTSKTTQTGSGSAEPITSVGSLEADSRPASSALEQDLAVPCNSESESRYDQIVESVPGDERYERECPVCLEEMEGACTIYKCQYGHLTCGLCRIKMERDECPLCRDPFTGRAWTAERLIAEIPRRN